MLTTSCSFLFQSYGWCSRGSHCSHSHSVDSVLDVEHEKRQKRKRKRNRNANNEGSEMITSEQEEDDSNDIEIEDGKTGSQYEGGAGGDGENGEGVVNNGVTVRRSGTHRAGFDSFMTGFAFAVALTKYGAISKSDDGTDSTVQISFDEVKNKVALSGKDIPLLIRKSNFAKTSALHNEKIKKIRIEQK